MPLDRLQLEGVRMAREVLQHSPTAIRCLKAAFNAETDGLAGIQELADKQRISSIGLTKPWRDVTPSCRNAIRISRDGVATLN